MADEEPREPLDDETVEVTLKEPLTIAIRGNQVREYPAGKQMVHPEVVDWLDEQKAQKAVQKAPAE